MCETAARYQERKVVSGPVRSLGSRHLVDMTGYRWFVMEGRPLLLLLVLGPQ